MLKIYAKNTDISIDCENYLDDSVEIEFLASDKIEIGYYKPFGALYIDLKNGEPASVSFSEPLRDETRNLSRSGFLKWDKNRKTWQKEERYGHNLYWFDIVFDDTAELEINGINLVFSNDADLKEVYPSISNFLPKGAQSFIAYHQEARNFILTHMRNKGKTVRSQEQYKMLDQFDLHDFNEVRQAAKYLALSNIFFNESDSTDDKWYQRARDFYAMYAASININFLSIDENDDGRKTPNETQSLQYIEVRRL